MNNKKALKIAIASGKGGTGKTTVATNLAVSLNGNGSKVAYVDCDVEAPNGHIFMKPVISGTETVGIPVPEVDPELCNNCGLCSKICEFGAIANLGIKTLVFPELCHGCGGCTLVCPKGAIKEVSREIGVVENGMSEGIVFMQGRLNIGQAMSPPLIRELKRNLPDEGIVIMDSPPGTSCPVIEAVKSSDYVILVTEPTPFGLNDLILAVEMLKTLDIPFGVIINRDQNENSNVDEYCSNNNIEILTRIPEDRQVAEAYSNGIIAVDRFPEIIKYFSKPMEKIKSL
jgi:MinD superfamily P-loop ATPase